jgi:sugar phosphate isomerase/epimerase
VKIGIVSGIFLNYPIGEAIRRVADAGYDSIDIWSGRPHIYRQDFSEKELTLLRRLVSNCGLTVSSFLPAFYRYPYSLSNPNDIMRQDSIQYMKECMDNAVALGAPVMLIVPGRSLYGQDLEDAKGRLLESIDTVCNYNQQYDIGLGIEPINKHACDLINTAADAMGMVTELGNNNLGVILDTGHMHLENDEVQKAMIATGDRLLQFHVNDNDGEQQQNLVPGDGTYDFPGFVATLQEAGFDGTLTAELGYHYTDNPDPAVQLTAQRLRGWL